MRRSNDLARRLIVLMRRDRGVRIYHGQEKRGADYEPKYVLISLGERHLRAGEGPDEADLQPCSQCFHRRRNVGGIIARRMCKDDHCTASDGQDVGESAAEAWASRQSSCKPQEQSRSVELAQRMAHSGRPSRFQTGRTVCACCFVGDTSKR